MFDIEKFNNLVVPCTVQFNIEQCDGSKIESQFKAHFKILSDDEVKTLAQKGDRELLQAVVVGWEGIEDKGKTIDFSSQQLEDLCQLTFWRVQVINAYYECAAVCARKNSLRLPSSG